MSWLLLLNLDNAFIIGRQLHIFTQNLTITYMHALFLSNIQPKIKSHMDGTMHMAICLLI